MHIYIIGFGYLMMLNTYFPECLSKIIYLYVFYLYPKPFDFISRKRTDVSLEDSLPVVYSGEMTHYSLSYSDLRLL